GAAARLAVRVFAAGTGHHDGSWLARVNWLSTFGEGFDALGIALAAARLRAEHRVRAAVALGGIFVLTIVVAWSALRGSGDGATTWQVLSSRALGDLVQSPAASGPLGTRFAIETLAVLLSGAVVLWPGRISAGMVSVGLALLARPSVDVPAAALALAVGALGAPPRRPPVIGTSRAFTRPAPGPQPRTLGADHGSRGGRSAPAFRQSGWPLSRFPLSRSPDADTRSARRSSAATGCSCGRARDAMAPTPAVRIPPDSPRRPAISRTPSCRR